MPSTETKQIQSDFLRKVERELFYQSWNSGKKQLKKVEQKHKSIPLSIVIIASYDSAVWITVVEVEFTEVTKDVEWENPNVITEGAGTFDAKTLLSSDTNQDELTWSITGTPTATIDSEGVVTFSETYKYNTETEGIYTVTATSTLLVTCTDDFELNVIAFKKCPDIKAHRKGINVFSLQYGHWWLKDNDSDESYGWWPKGLNEKMGSNATLTQTLWNTITGVDGELNGQTDYFNPMTGYGSATTDPYHGSSGDEVLDLYIKSDRDCADAWADARSYATGYSGGWSWPFGTNCRNFQTSMRSAGKLKIESEVDDHYGFGE